MIAEVRAGEAGVLRAALGEVQAMDGIDANVRLFLWSGGVVDVTLPVLDAVRYPPGAQVVVMFLSDRPESGVILGAVDGNLSWRRLGAAAWAQQVRPALAAVLAQAVREPGQVTVMPGCFPAPTDTAGGVLLPDGRVFLLPAHGDAPAFLLDPATLALHRVPWPGSPADTFQGGCLLWDGRIFVAPGPDNTVGQAYLYDPTLDRVTPAGQPLATTCGGCTLLADGRVLLARYLGDQPLIFDPAADTMQAVQASTAGLNCLGALLLPDTTVLLTTAGGGLWRYDPAADTVEALALGLPDAGLPELGAYAGGVLLADGRVLLVPVEASTPACLFDPDTLAAVMLPLPASDANWRGGVLLPDGRALLLPAHSAAGAALVYDPATNSLSAVPELAGVETATSGGCALPDGRVVFGPGRCPDLVVWEPGCGVGFGRDIALSAWWNRG